MAKVQPAIKGEKALDEDLFCTVCGCERGECYVPISHYLLSCGLWTKLIIVTALYYGAIFGLAYWKNGLAEGQVHLVSIQVLGEICFTALSANVIPFLTVPLIMRTTFHGSGKIADFTQPIHPDVFKRGAWRLWPAMQWKNWCEMQCVCSYVCIRA